MEIDDEIFKLSDNLLEDILERVDYPPYRDIFTEIQSTSIVIKDDNDKFNKHILNIEMPSIELTKEGNSQQIFKKYLEPSEYNVFLQDKFKEWKDQIAE